MQIVAKEMRRRARTLRYSIFLVYLFIFCLPYSEPARAGQLGANKFDLFLQYLPLAPEGSVDGGAQYVRKSMAKKAIADSHDAGLSFLRVAVTGFFPAKFDDQLNDLKLWQQEPDKFWGAMDEMFDDLDKQSVKIVPTLAWNIAQFAAASRNSVTEFMTIPNSSSNILFRNFIREFINRYKERDTIAFYELSNEMNLHADLDMHSRCPKAEAQLCPWGNFTTSEMIAFSTQIVTFIKSLDPKRAVTSGHTLPRSAAMHLINQPEFSPAGPNWAPDSLEEFKQNIVLIHEPFDTVSVHIYPGMQSGRAWRPSLAYKLVYDAEAAAEVVGKPLFVGEFGDTGPTDFMRNFLNELVRNRVEFAAIWIWEYYQHFTYKTHDSEADRFSLEPGYDQGLIPILLQAEQAMGATHHAIDGPKLPRVVLTWPLPCGKVEHSTEIAAVASLGAGAVTKVEFLVDGRTIATVDQAPYVTPFDPSSWGDRTVEIAARAYSSSNTYAESKSNVTLNKAEPRDCSLPH